MILSLRFQVRRVWRTVCRATDARDLHRRLAQAPVRLRRLAGWCLRLVLGGLLLSAVLALLPLTSSLGRPLPTPLDAVLTVLLLALPLGLWTARQQPGLTDADVQRARVRRWRSGYPGVLLGAALPTGLLMVLPGMNPLRTPALLETVFTLTLGSGLTFWGAFLSSVLLRNLPPPGPGRRTSGPAARPRRLVPALIPVPVRTGSSGPGLR